MFSFQFEVAFLEEPPFVTVAPPDPVTGRCPVSHGIVCHVGAYAPLNRYTTTRKFQNSVPLFLEALQSIMSHPRLRVPSFSGSSSTIKLETSSYPSFLDGSEGNTKATLRPAAISRTAVRIGTRLLPARPRTTATGRRWATSAVRVSVSTCCRSWPTISASRTT